MLVSFAAGIMLSLVMLVFLLFHLFSLEVAVIPILMLLVTLFVSSTTIHESVDMIFNNESISQRQLAT